MKHTSLLIAFAGLALATGLIGWFGFDRVVAATVSVGWGGFAVFLGCQLLLSCLLGLAWLVLVPRVRRYGLLTWARMVRDGAANCLPFAVPGGIVAGAQALTAAGISWPTALGSSLVDITAEFLGQIAFVALGLVMLLVRAPQSRLAWPIGLALVGAVAASAVFVYLQLGAGRIVRVLLARIAGDRLPGALERVEVLQAELAGLYGRTGLLALGVTVHFFGWIGTGIIGWAGYRLLGADIDLGAVLAIEAMLQVLLTAAFLVPGAVGVQEAGYASIGLVFGLAPELSLGLSLLRRARDLALGVPVLLIWQLTETRRLVRPSLDARSGAGHKGRFARGRIRCRC